ncbi:hypothetical protein [Delftia sp. CH05]|uniref:hypothetical protein n=1 Tax=Delftia sp. CH05 TaxID=2692194 RepID=UPI00135E2C64|nr:hypothetical protein [Delftia sp. CH05]MXN29170.1 hypothetical protein [Delftia sp. CH05]
MEKWADQPISVITVIDEINREQQFLVKVIPASGYSAYMLVDKEGNQSPKSFKTETGSVVNYVFFDALWIEKDDVYSLVIATKQKDIYMGKLK